MTFVNAFANSALDSQLADGVTYYLGVVKGSAGLSTGSNDNEATEAGYARQAITFQDDPGNPRGKQNVATVTIPFTETVSGLTHWIVCTGDTEGASDVRAFGALSSTRNFDGAGGSLVWATGALKIQVAG